MRTSTFDFSWGQLLLLSIVGWSYVTNYLQPATVLAASAPVYEVDAHAASNLTAPTSAFTLARQAAITTTQINNDYLSNPGIGWQEAQTLDNPLLPETTTYRRSQYSWQSQNPAENVFDWSKVDADLQAAANAGKQFSFRIYSMRSESGEGHQVPQWVLNKGAVILPTGQPDYSNCVYQAEWAKFVEAMRQKYDGDPNIAFIDISGYGNFNEWSWQDQTDVEPNSLDTQARQHLADMFIGGAGTIQCQTAAGQVQTVSYDYPGFQSTQLLMPYAGIEQSTRYVAGRRTDVGFRHDCLGSASHTNSMIGHVGDVIANTWRKAPIVYEFCSGGTTDLNFMLQADTILRLTHGSLVHDNLAGERSVPALTALLKFVGYRFALLHISHPTYIEPGDNFSLSMTWANLGYAPAYLKMGQDFELHFYLFDSETLVKDWLIPTDMANWMPADPLPGAPPRQVIKQTLSFPGSPHSKIYSTRVAIINKRTNRPINLPLTYLDPQGRYSVGTMIVPGPDLKSVFLPLLLK